MKLGFIGVGHMGKFMAGNLIKAGHELTICDRRPEARTEEVLAGATWVATPREVAAASHIVITSLPGPEQVDQVVLGKDGILEGVHEGDFYIDMSTSTPGNIRAIAERARAKGVAVLDAPVAGGMRGARNGTLTIMVGASPDSFKACEQVFKGMGEQIFLVGDVGAGHVAKLVNNMMTIVNGLTAMEAMVVGVKAGVDPARLLEVAQAGTGGSFSLNIFPYVIFKRSFDPVKFGLALAAKDLRIANEYAEDLGIPLPVVSHAAAALAEAMKSGLADKDWTTYITLLEKQAGVEVHG